MAILQPFSVCFRLACVNNFRDNSVTNEIIEFGILNSSTTRNIIHQDIENWKIKIQTL